MSSEELFLAIETLLIPYGVHLVYDLVDQLHLK